MSCTFKLYCERKKSDVWEIISETIEQNRLKQIIQIKELLQTYQVHWVTNNENVDQLPYNLWTYTNNFWWGRNWIGE